VHFDTAFATQERGGVRDGNDKTTQSRADHFVRWLDGRGITRDDLITLLTDAAQTTKLIGAFVWDIKQGHGLKQTKHPGPGTIAGCIKSAALWLQTEFRFTLSTPCLNLSGGSTGLHPLLSDLIASQRTCSKPQQKKEPFTFALFEYLRHGVSVAAKRDIQTLLGRTAAIFDWTGCTDACAHLTHDGRMTDVVVAV
jgi:hypothetical protein